MNNLSVAQAVIQLKEAEIISNEEVFRRWLREGKVQGAFIKSKRQGWQIPEEAIIHIIDTQKSKSSNNKEKQAYDQGYSDGYEAAQADFKAKMRKLVVRGGYDKEFSLFRQDFREMAPIKTKEYLQFADNSLFKWGVKTPRKTAQVHYLEGWFSYDNGAIVLFQEDYEIDSDLGLESQAIQCLGEYLRQKFIATQSKIKYD